MKVQIVNISITLLFCKFVNTLPINFNDLDLASSDLKTEFKEVSAKEFGAAQSRALGGKGDRGYKTHHQVENGNKGQHEKEEHKKQYAAADEIRRSHNHDGAYYAEKNKDAKKQQGYHFEDKGTYAKGHDTKGLHTVHKLNEFKTKTDFFDDNVDNAYKENHGAFDQKKSILFGMAEKGGNGKKKYLERTFGKTGKFENGHYYSDDIGYVNAKKQDKFYDNGAIFGKEVSRDAFTKLGFAEKEPPFDSKTLLSSF